MNTKMIKAFARVSLVMFYLFYSELSYSAVTYLPQDVRKCLEYIYEANEKIVGNDFADLCSMIAQNRVLSDEKMVRSVINEALALKDPSNEKWLSAAQHYLSEYLVRLNERSILLKIEGEAQASVTMPSAFLARSLNTDLIHRDMIVLTGELTSLSSIELCGNARLDADLLKANHAIPKAANLTGPSVIFNPNMLTTTGSSYPNVVFGTGVSSPVITAWAMHTSTSLQSPINMQFSIPANLKTGNPVSIEMHFLVKKQFSVNGNARVRVNALYVNNNTQFAKPEIMSFTNTTDSANFAIVEPTDADDLMHISIEVPISQLGIDKSDFALISFSRIYPDGLLYEYPGDIYLVAAVFKYTQA